MAGYPDGFTDQVLAANIVSQPEMLSSYNENTVRPSLNITDFGDTPRDIVEQFEREALEELDGFEFAQISFFAPRAEIHRENFRYHFSHQWSDIDMRGILEEHRKPYVFNQIRQYSQTILGEQRSQRTDLRGLPKTRYVQDKVEGINHFFRFFQETNRFHSKNSEIFEDGFIGGVGVGGVMLDPLNPRGRVLYDRYYPLEFMWDVPSAKDPLLSTTKYVWRGTNYSLSSALDEYPAFADEIRAASGYQGDKWFYNLQTMIQPMIHAPANRLVSSTIYNPMLYRTFRDYVFKREFYRRRYERRLCVQDRISDTTLYFTDANEAIDAYKQLFAFYSNPEIKQRFGIAYPLVTQPFEAQAPFVDKLVFIGQKLVSVQTVQTSDVPYKFYIPEWKDGELTSYIEHGKGYQRFINRIMMFMDQRISGVKGITAVNKGWLDSKWTDDKIRQEIVSSNPVFIVDKEDPEFNINALIQNVPPPINGTDIEAMRQILVGGLGNLFGGPNSVGNAAFAGQSGESAQALMSQATTRTIPLYDRFADYEKTVGEHAAYLMQFLDPTIQMAVQNEYGEVQFGSLADFGIRNPEDYDWMVNVTQVKASDSEQAANLQRMAMIAQTNPDYANAIAPMMIDELDIDASKKRQMLQNLKAQQDAQAQQVQHQQELETAQMLLKERTEQHQFQVRMRELDIQEKNMPKISLAGKLDGSMPSALLATELNYAGQDVDPLGVASDLAGHMVLKQDEANMNQKNYWNNLAPEEKAAIANKAYTNKKAGTDTPKDKKARANKKVSKQ